MLPIGGAAKIGTSLSNPVSFGITIVSTLLSALFGNIFGGGDTKALRRDVNALRDQVSQAIDQTQRFSWKGIFTTGFILKMLHSLWGGVFRPMLDKIEQLARRVAGIYTRVIVPLLNSIGKIKAYLDKLYFKYLRPILNAIQIVRKYLAILRAFNVKWAGALDDKLARLEGKIIAPYLWVLGQLNGLGGWMNVILTAGGALQRAVFLNTLWHYRGDLVNVWWAAQTSTTAPTAATVRPAPRTVADSVQSATDFSRTGGGAYALPVSRGVARFNQITAGGF